MPWAALLLPAAVVLAVLGPRLSPRLTALLGWLGWVGAWALLLGVPSFPPHSATDYRLALAPLLLLPMLAPKRWAGLSLGLAAALLLGLSLQSLWARSAIWESAGIALFSLATLLGTDHLSRQPHRPWVLPILGLGVGILLAVNHSIRLGIEAAVIGGIALCFRGHPALNRGGLLALTSVVVAACAYAYASTSLPLILCSVLALGILRGRAQWAQITGVVLPLLVGSVPGVLALLQDPM